ncbi:MAG TPA: hypothetical protein VGG39_17510 [Polyangiaceae bacterium]|jgi:hypothetical protein
MAQVSNIDEYRGPDRRRNRIYVTMNTEYHCHDRICVAVFDRHTGNAQPSNRAIGKTLTGSIRFDRDNISATSAPEIPHVGDQLCFASGRKDDFDDIVTSTLVRIERPNREVVVHYPQLAMHG